MNKEQLVRYAIIKRSIKELEEELDILQPEILNGMISEGADVLETEEGNFTLTAKRKYAYPEFIAKAEASLKEQKKEAEATGTATYQENKYIVFKSKSL